MKQQMKKSKRYLSVLLSVALVVASLGMGFGRLGAYAVTQAVGQMGSYRFRVQTSGQDCQGTGTANNLYVTINYTDSTSAQSNTIQGESSPNYFEAGNLDTIELSPQLPAKPISSISFTSSGGDRWKVDWTALDYWDGNAWQQIASTGGFDSGGGTWTMTYPSGTISLNTSSLNKTLTFSYNYSGSPAAVQIYSEQGATLPASNIPTFTRTGYTFTGWSPSVPSTGPSADTIYYAQWTVNYYTITFDANGGAGGWSQSLAYGSTLTPPTVTRTGYTFTGWNPTPPGTVPASNATYTAQWSVNTYYVIFDANGGSGSMSSQGIQYGASAVLTSNAFTRTGYSFTGWNTVADGSGTSYANGATFGPMPANNVTLYAQWSINSYTITFDANGGTGGWSQSLVYGSTLTPPTVTRTGYTFTGWSPTPPGTVPASDATYTAQWSINTYYIIFDANGGSGSMSSQGISYGSSATLTSNAFTRTGYTFTGWNTAANGSGTSYGNGATFGPMPANNVTLYAQWSINTYYIIFDANGGSGSMSNQGISYGSSATLTSNAFTRTGYTFTGWNTAANGSGTSYANGATFGPMPANNVTLYAQWTVNYYTITFDANGGTGGWSQSLAYGSTLTPPTVTRTGYTFNSWSPTPPGTVPASNATYTAQWTVNTYYVIFNANGGSGSMSNQGISYGSSANLTANAFSRTGYTFNGWNTAADGSGTAYADEANFGPMGASNVTLYAQWIVNYYYLTYDANGGTGGTGPTLTAYGTPLTPPTVTRTGYSFSGWQPAVPSTMPAANSTYTAQWTINQYTVSFESNGGSAVGSITQNYNTQVAQPANPTKTGYTFYAWYHDAGLTNPVSWPYTLGAADVTFYAKWTVNQYTIYFDEQGGSTVPDITQDYGTTVTAPADPTKTGYTFAGWSPAVPSTMPANDITCVAQWTPNQYTVSFDSNGGSAVGSITQNYNTQVAQPANPTKTGHTFAGWYYDAGLTNPVSWPYTLGASNVTFYAKWTINQYTVYFDEQGGSTVPDITQDYGTAVTAPANPTRTGYSFAGWSPAVPSTMPAEDTYCVAQWTVNQYTIYFDEQGGSTVPDITQDYGTSVTAPANPTRTGYTFAGWSPAVPSTMPAEDTYCVAQWTVNQYTIYFNEQGGSTVPDITQDYGTSVTAPADPTRTGYTFTGWSPSVPLTMPAEDTYCAAQWTAHTYTVTYNGNGSDAGSTDDSSHIYDIAANLTSNGFTRTGFSFLGWSTDSGAVTPDYTDGQSVLNLTTADDDVVTFYAVWSVNNYLITFDANGGTGGTGPTSMVYNSPLSAPEVSRTGYAFDSWSPSVPANVPAADTTYTAQWTANTYTVTYDGNGSDDGSTADSIHTYDTASNLTVNGYTKDGYLFTGWNTAANGSGTAYTDGQSVLNLTAVNGATVTLYAQWIYDSFTIYFDEAGGSAVDDIVQAAGTPVTAPDDPTREGYSFNGWSPQVPALMPAEDTYCVAQWTMIPADTEEVEALIDFEVYIEMTGSEPVYQGDATQAGTVYYYGTPAQREAYNDAYLNALALMAESPMPDTAYNRGRISAAADALSDALAVLYANPNPADYTYCDEEMAAAGALNLNRYTTASLDELQAVADAVTPGKMATEQIDVNDYTTALYSQREDLVPYQDAAAPRLKVLETDAAMAGVTIPGYDPEDYGNVSYVYPGKAYYTYYCYTNSENPSIVVNIADLADGNGRLSYPTQMNVTKVSGLVNSGWMSYTYDSGQRAGTPLQGTVTVASNPYADYTIGMDYDPMGADYYRQAEYLVLKPEFVQAGGKQFAKYTISGKDDAAADGNLANTTSLAGGNQTYRDGVAMTTTNQAVTPLNTITIYVEYRNSMSLDGGVWYDDGRSAASLRGYNNLLPDDQWVKKDYIYRTSGGATNDEIIGLGDTVYTANDPNYGQSGLACFYYWLSDTADADVIAEFNANGQYSATRMLMADIAANPGGYTLRNWPKTATSISGFDPNTNCRLVYVHMADRWGNVFNRIIKTNNVDAVAPVADQQGINGYVKITEDGGSAVQTIRLYQYAYEGTPSYVISYWSSKLIADLGVISSEDNTFDIHVNPAEITDPSGRLTLYVKDKAGNEMTKTVKPDANGDILFEIVDPVNMPGGGAVNSAGGIYTFLFDDTVTVKLNVPGAPKLTALSTTVIDEENGFIYGLAEGMTQMAFEADYVRVTGNGRLAFTPAGGFGTGTKVELIDNETNEVLKAYTVVIFGDVNGDANIDSSDAALITDFENFAVAWALPADAAYLKAADLSGDGNVDSSDAALVCDYENFALTINQVNGNTTLIE